MKKQETIWVRNNGTESFSNRYDGEDFVISPGKTIEMLIESATLVLGFGEEDKSRCLRRLGWVSNSSMLSEGAKRLAEFSFHMTEHEALQKPQMNHSSAPVVSDEATAEVSAPAVVIAPRIVKKRGRKPGQKNFKKIPSRQPIQEIPAQVAAG